MRPASSSPAAPASKTSRADGAGAGVGLQAAAPPAAAQPRAGHLDLLMAQLGAVAVAALQDLAAQDDAPADARAQGEQHHALHPPAGPRPVFAHGGGVG